MDGMQTKDMNKLVFLGLAVPIFLLLIPNVYASLNNPREPFTEEERESGFYNGKGYLLGKSNRPAINPGLDPDEDCKFDAYQIKCQPGSEQECPWGPGTNEDESCVPSDVECPDGYNIEDNDETGQCIPNEVCEGYDDMVLIEREGEGDRCATLYYICGDDEHREEDYCIEYCNENPDGHTCRIDDPNSDVN